MGRGFNKSPRGGSNGRGHSRGDGGGGRAFGKGQKHQQQRGGSRSFEPSPSRNSKQRGRQAFKPRPPPPLPESLSALPKFVKKPRFGGAKLGYFFSRGKAGLGYYVDRVQIGNMGDKLKARLAATLKPAAEVVAKPINSKGLTDGEATGAGRASGIAKVQEGAKKMPLVKSNGKKAEGASIDSVEPKPSAPGAGDGSRGGSSDEDGSEEDSAEDSSEEEEEEEGNGIEGSAAGKGGVVDDESSSDEGSDDEGEENDAAAVATNRGKEKQAAKEGTGKPVVVNGGSSVQESEEEEEGSESDGVESSQEEDEENEEEEDDEEDGVRGEEPKSTESHNEVSGAEGVDGDEEEAQAPQEDDEKKSFESLGVTGPLCEAAAQLGWTHATEIQKHALPLAFEVRTSRDTLWSTCTERVCVISTDMKGVVFVSGVVTCSVSSFASLLGDGTLIVCCDRRMSRIARRIAGNNFSVRYTRGRGSPRARFLTRGVSPCFATVCRLARETWECAAMSRHPRKHEARHRGKHE